jgi:hypothetical protein
MNLAGRSNGLADRSRPSLGGDRRHAQAGVAAILLAMPEKFVGYRGGFEVHDATVAAVEHDGDVARIVIEAVDGRRIMFAFSGVASLTQIRAEGMMLFGLSEFEATAPLRRFVFANWDDDDDARLEVVAAGFERRELQER